MRFGKTEILIKRVDIKQENVDEVRFILFSEQDLHIYEEVINELGRGSE